MHIQPIHRFALFAVLALAGAREASAATVECRNDEAVCVVSNDGADLIECECIHYPGSGGVGVTGGIDGSQWDDEELPEVCESMLLDLGCEFEEDGGTTGVGTSGTTGVGDDGGEVSTGTTGIGDDGGEVSTVTTGIGDDGHPCGTSGVGDGGEVTGGETTGIEGSGDTGIGDGGEVTSGSTTGIEEGGDDLPGGSSSGPVEADSGVGDGPGSSSSSGFESADSGVDGSESEAGGEGGEIGSSSFNPPDGWAGCSVAPGARGGTGAMMLLGLTALGVRRRRRSRA